MRREAPAPCGRQVASVVRKNLAGEDGDPLAMACGPIFGIGIDNFATGEHTGQKRLPSRCPFRHPAVRRPYGLFQIVAAWPHRYVICATMAIVGSIQATLAHSALTRR